MTRDAHHFQVGPSAMHWDGSVLVVDVDELAVPHLGRVQGQVLVELLLHQARCGLRVCSCRRSFNDALALVRCVVMRCAHCVLGGKHKTG